VVFDKQVAGHLGNGAIQRNLTRMLNHVISGDPGDL